MTCLLEMVKIYLTGCVSISHTKNIYARNMKATIAYYLIYYNFYDL